VRLLAPLVADLREWRMAWPSGWRRSRVLPRGRSRVDEGRLGRVPRERLEDRL